MVIILNRSASARFAQHLPIALFTHTVTQYTGLLRDLGVLSVDQLQGKSVEDLCLVGVTQSAAIRILQDKGKPAKPIPADPPAITDDADDDGSPILLIPMSNAGDQRGFNAE